MDGLRWTRLEILIKYGLDYDKTFSQVAKINIVHVVLELAASKTWRLCHINVKNAFSHGELDREICWSKWGI